MSCKFVVLAGMISKPDNNASEIPTDKPNPGNKNREKRNTLPLTISHPTERIWAENTNHSIAGSWNAVGDVEAVAVVAGVGAAGFARRLHHEVAAEVGPAGAAAAAEHWAELAFVLIADAAEVLPAAGFQGIHQESWQISALHADPPVYKPEISNQMHKTSVWRR